MCYNTLSRVLKARLVSYNTQVTSTKHTYRFVDSSIVINAAVLLRPAEINVTFKRGAIFNQAQFDGVIVVNGCVIDRCP